MAEEAGIAVRCRGMRQAYALLLCRGGKVRLLRLFDGEQVLAESSLDWRLDQACELSLACRGDSLEARCDGVPLFAVEDPLPGLESGGVALVLREGRMSAGDVAIGRW
jgi:hypothetical protein